MTTHSNGRTSRRRLFALVAAAVAGAIWLAIPDGGDDRTSADETSAPAPSSPTVVLADPNVGRLRAELDDLRSDVTAIAGQLSGDPEAATVVETIVPRDEKMPAHDPATLAALKERTEKEKAFYAEFLAGDPVDAAWSPEAERIVRSSFVAAAPTDAALEEVTCRSKLCRIALRFPSEMAREAGAANLPSFIPWDTAGVMHQDEDDPTRVVLYASRQIDMLPRMP